MLCAVQQMGGHAARGIANLGNTCYLASVAQLLAHSRPLVRELLLASAPADEAAAPTWAALADLLWQLWVAAPASGGAPASAAALLRALQLRTPMGRAGTLHDQSDAHELVVQMVDALATERRPPSAALLAGLAARGDCRPDEPDPEHRWRAELGKMAAPDAGRLFYGQILYTVRCGACSATSQTDELFCTLPVAIRGPTAQACVDAHLATDALPEWRCERCGQQGQGALSARVRRAPPVLILALKRFVDPWRVLRAPVAPDEALSLGGAATYRLSGVVCHYGLQGGGHYVAVCRRPADVADGSNAWWCTYDDGVATPAPGGLRSAAPADAVYLLAYDIRARGGAEETPA